MTARTRTAGLAITAALAFTSLSAGAQIYKWTNETGSVTYSNTPPADPTKVNDVIKIDDINTAPLDTRPKVPSAEAAAAAGRDVPAAISTGVTGSAEPAAPRAQSASRALQPEAVQDPCLRSADPQCYQRNREKYHPYMGYTPATVRAPVTGAIGASASPPGTGAIGGQGVPAPAAEKRAVPAGVVAPAINVRSK